MKNKIRKGFVFGTVFVLLTTMIVLFGINNVNGATTHTVGIAGSGADYNSIQTAINAASDGDTIRVWAGTYSENVVINKLLSVIGNSSSNTIIDGGGSGDAVQIVNNSVIFKKFTVQNSGNSYSGINLTADYCEITDVICSNNGYGINLYQYANYNIIGTSTEGITCTGNKVNSIRLYYSWNNNFTNINISQITTNFATNHDSAIKLNYWDRDNTFDTITINNNYDTTGATTTYYNGIHIHASSGGSSIGNTINNSEIKYTKNGIYLEGTAATHILMEKNKIHLNKENGIFLNDTSTNVIVSHKPDGSDSWGIHDNDKHGIYAFDSHNLNISYNYIFDNNKDNDSEGDGIYMKDCGDTIDSNNNDLNENGIYNTASGYQQYGIHIYNTTDTWIRDNNQNYNNSYGIYKNKKDGIYIDSTVETGNVLFLIQGNWIYENEDNGIHLLDSSAIKINTQPNSGYRNKIYDNKDDGILLEDADSITIEDGIIYNSASSETQQNGIHMKKDTGGGASTDNTIQINTTIYNNDKHGIYIEYGENITIDGCTMYDNNDDDSGDGDGIRLEYSKNNNINGSTMENSAGGSEYQKYGLHFLDSDDNTVNASGAYRNKLDGIYLNSKSDGNTIERSNGQFNTGNGLFIEGTSTNKPKNNVIQIDCDFQQNTENGIYFKYAGTDGNPNKIISSEVINNGGHGIKFEYSDYNEITNNIIQSNSNSDKAGIFLYNSYLNTISGNTIESNDFGIYLDGASTFNTIIDNTIEDNADYGIKIYDEDSDDNDIYHNDFIDNNVGYGAQAFDDDVDLTNDWHNGYTDPVLDPDTEGGNYWNDHDEPDEGVFDEFQGSDQDQSGGDQIADLGDPVGGKNPYSIDGNAGTSDEYPFVSRRT